MFRKFPAVRTLLAHIRSKSVSIWESLSKPRPRDGNTSAGLTRLTLHKGQATFAPRCVFESRWLSVGQNMRYSHSNSTFGILTRSIAAHSCEVAVVGFAMIDAVTVCMHCRHHVVSRRFDRNLDMDTWTSSVPKYSYADRQAIVLKKHNRRPRKQTWASSARGYPYEDLL